ncbi:nucleoside ABC transporter membrane protein [Sediminihabitans luteus]|uniref:Nucleoside ABC transporter membrane protein n=1 Tax=Sediminihabitans luteus TaxID=1138585 RepID=A0A2M9CYG2_9CELL|nr:ABC transporter permease [Sediminihabitans luteus]PJJ76976.1 nucleoside ABC transporter membrane protein [Sediminihabitans luteus]GII99617.1 ABC transporter permease [Sediminihabitans luteus]
MSVIETKDAPGRQDVTVGAGASMRGPVVMLAFGVLSLVLFGLLPDSGGTTTFGISTSSDFVRFDPVELPSKATAIVLSLVALALAAYGALRVRGGRKVPTWVLAAFGAIWVLTFLTWAVTDKSTSLVSLLQGSLLLAVPLAFGALGGLLNERAGVVNIAIEGQLLTGAFGAAVIGSVTGNPYAGLVAAPAFALVIGAMLALFTVKYHVNQIIVGVVLNVFAVGLTSFLFGSVLKDNAAQLNSPPRLETIAIPGLSQIPVLGPVLFRQTIIVYLLYVAVAVIAVALFRTRWGLRVRAVGEYPQAADTVGIDVNRTRWGNVLLGSAVAGLGGAFFTIGSVGAFGEEMTAGKGYIALAAMILGRWSPVGALTAALLFGFADKLQQVLGVLQTPIPNQFMLMLPYIVTIFAVAGLVGRVRGPAAAGEPYVKG